MPTAAPSPAPAALPIDNRSLFSDHFLQERLSAHPGWAGDLEPERQAVLARWQAVRARPPASEAATEQELIRPVLEALGWAFDVQPAVRGVGGTQNRPDYALFAETAQREAAGGGAAAAAGDPRYWHAAAAVADAKAWGRSLDAGGAGGGMSNANPSFQIVAYLFVTGVQWAVLTNGREWRLYSARARSRVDTYFAVDLHAVLESGDPEAFRWFARFFGAASFRPAAATGRTFVDDVLDASTEYGRALETQLKRLIFERVFGGLAQGFVRHRRESGLPAESSAELGEIYEGTLRLLYRVLFVLHAEARDLLPVRERGYARYSLARLRRKVAEAVDEGAALSEVSTDLWNDLSSLFRIIDHGDARIGVPRYDGGLFAEAHPLNRFLGENAIGDAWLYPALDWLSRDDDGHFIDYKALDVEQLGSLYEGLLEHRLRLDANDAPELVNDRGERHATGSYYTPHYVVEYIVAETVGPVLAARAEEFREAMAQLSGPGAPSDAPLLLRAAAERLLSIRICDPAMGSGHFLVHAANWLTEGLILLLSEYPDNPVLAELAQVRAEIMQQLAEDGITVDAAQLRDTALLKRMVIKRCIYGVDLNPMATELAKLSLWLDSFTVGAPLSFLDHHLKHGNSLVGTRVLDVSRAMEANPLGQFDSFGGPFAHVLRAAELMLDVAAQTDATADRVQESSRVYAEFEGVMAPYKRLLDLWVSRGFGNKRAEELVSVAGAAVLDWARGRPARFNKDQKAALERAEALRREQHFFHWDLEFPEVFVDLSRAAWKENPGFDVVIGNPPYVRQEQVKTLKPFLASEYADVHDGAADLYVYFYREGLELLRAGGRLSYIVTNKWLRAGYGQGLRRFFADRGRVARIVDFGHAPIFPEADVFPVIVVVERPEDPQRTPADPQTLVTRFPREALGGAIKDYIDANAYAVPTSRFSEEPWSLEPPEVERLVEKMRGAGVPLHIFVGASPVYGVKTGFNDAFRIDAATRSKLISEDPACADIIKPYLRGQDIKRWIPEWADWWMIFTRRGIDIDKYPAVKRHLSQYRKDLEPQPPNWNEAKKGKWPGRKAGSYEWYELQDTVDYWPLFERPKIITQDLATYSWFCIDREGLYPVNTCYVWPTEDLYVLAWLCSPAAWWLFHRTLQHGINDTLRMFREQVETVPIPVPTDDIRTEAEAAVARLIEITAERRQAHGEMLDWLRTQFEVDKPGQKLEAFADLSSDDFVAAVVERRPRKSPSPGPRQVADLRKAHGDYAPRLARLDAVAGGLERRLAQLVNQAYGLTADEVELMWRTAPPRMPVGR